LATQSGASSVGPSEHCLAAVGRLSVAEGLVARRSARLKIRKWTPPGSGYGHAAAQNRPLRLECQGLDAARARNRPSFAAARLALALGGPEKRWNRPKRRFRRCTGRLNATQPGVNGRQHPVHTWIERSVQGKRRGAATVAFIHEKHIKMPLTLWF